MNEDARILSTAESLIAEHGYAEAARVATAEIMRLYDAEDRYSLSLWREVRKIIADKTTVAEEEAKDKGEKLDPLAGKKSA
ncbi:MAG: hypothetical protein ACPGOV_16830 [Magnetovibrionaceae bacterium]